MKRPKRSPWGPVDHFCEFALGMANVGTPRHGGIKLNRARNAKMPEAVRRRGGWYEEDCEWALVALVFPEEFSEQEREDAEQTAKDYYPAEYTAVTGKSVDVEESYILRKKAFEAKTRTMFVVQSACGDWADWVPEGMVGVKTRRASDGATRTFLVPEDEYRSQDGNPFVVDELRHLLLSF